MYSNRIKIFMLAAAALCLPQVLQASENTEPALTLDECLAIALSDNPTVRIADMEVTRMDYSKK